MASVAPTAPHLNYMKVTRMPPYATPSAAIGTLEEGVSAVFAVRANLDFYKNQVLGDNGWW